jgi:hypothetical protein
MPKKHELEFANFILKFGQEGVLLDYVEEIVIPAFMQKGERSYGRTKHFFHHVEILNLGESEELVPCIVGRYIKNTVVSREQVYDEEGQELIKDNESLNTSPSAIFILILNNHRLIYFSETSYSPSLRSFQLTVAKLLREKYHTFIDQTYQERITSNTPITKKQLYIEHDPL